MHMKFQQKQNNNDKNICQALNRKGHIPMAMCCNAITLNFDQALSRIYVTTWYLAN